MICAIDFYVIEKTCEAIQMLIRAGKSFDNLSVRISPVLFLQASFTATVLELMERFEVPEGKLSLELSENVLLSAFPNIGILMQELSDAGVVLVLTDFGSGFSAINNVLSLPVDVLKLSRMFIWQLETNPRSGVMIHGLIQIAHELGLKLVAEGVETENQVTLLGQYGCVYEQGFYYSSNVDREELADLIG